MISIVWEFEITKKTKDHNITVVRKNGHIVDISIAK